MVRSKSTLFALSMCAALVSGTPTYATDASIGANAGYAFTFGAESIDRAFNVHPECFQRPGGSVIVNTGTEPPFPEVCTDQFWIIPLLTPFTGHHYRVGVRASPGGGEPISEIITATSCTVYSFDNENRTFMSGPPRSTIAVVTLQDLVTENIYVLGPDDRINGHHGPGTLEVDCVVGEKGGELVSVHLTNLD